MRVCVNVLYATAAGACVRVRVCESIMSVCVLCGVVEALGFACVLGSTHAFVHAFVRSGVRACVRAC